LVKHTSSSHSDYDTLKASLEAIKETTDLLNESKRFAESTTRLRAIQENLIGDFVMVVDWRLCFKEGDLIFLEKKAHERYVFLCSDAIISTKKKKDKYKFKGAIQLEGCQVTDISDPKSNSIWMDLELDGIFFFFFFSL
jgi:hypothetical protein